MHRFRLQFVLLASVAAAIAGCNLLGPARSNDAELEHFKTVAKTTTHPDQTAVPNVETSSTEAPKTALSLPTNLDYWDLTLDELVQIAISRSSVMRDLGGLVVRTPDTVRTIVGPSLVATDPRFGMEAALSEFDAVLSSSAYFEKNDRLVNNFIASGGGRQFQQDLHVFQSQLTKRGAAGTQMSLRGSTTYDANTASFNRFKSAYDSIAEAEIRQPLLQGAGVNFNRIAGPNSVPGFYNGVVVARVNSDISLADFEMGMRDLISNVDNAYWDLYFAYRDLDAKVSARNAALETWRRVKRMLEAGQAGVTSEREAQAREQYFRFEEDVQNALTGRLQDATTNNNGSSGGTFRGAGGVLVCERRLRLAVGLPITDSRLIRPAEEPTFAFVVFPWEDIVCDALSRRPELQRQRLVVKRRELELIASRNFLLPQLDIVGRYRYRGLGKNLIGDASNVPFDAADPDGHFQEGSIDNLLSGNFQEWRLGGELTMPVGFRRGYAALRNAQLQVVRDRAVLDEQERTIIHDLSNALSDTARSFQIMQTTYNRRAAAQEQVQLLRSKLEERLQISFDQLLDAERRSSDADVQFHRARVEYMLALKNVHYEKGTLLEYCHVHLADRLPPANIPRPHSANEIFSQPSEVLPTAPDKNPIKEPIPPIKEPGREILPPAPRPMPLELPEARLPSENPNVTTAGATSEPQPTPAMRQASLTTPTDPSPMKSVLQPARQNSDFNPPALIPPAPRAAVMEEPRERSILTRLPPP